MRRSLLRPRWLALHAVTVLLATAFLGLGWWQLKRGEAGNLRSFGYALEWPMFAAFTVFLWWRVVQDDRRTQTGEPPQRPVRSTTPAPDRPAPLPRVLTHPTRPTQARTTAAQSTAPPDRDGDELDERLAAYNRYLAELHAQDEQAAR